MTAGATLGHPVRRLRLGGKLQLILAAGFIITLTLALAFQTAQHVSASYTARREANLRITQDLAGPLGTAMPTRNSPTAYGYMEILEKKRTAAAVVIIAGSDVVKTQQSLDYIDMPIESLIAIALTAASSHLVQVIDQGQFQFVAVPVTDSAGRAIGAFGIAWSTQDLYETILREALIQTGIIGLACAALVWLIFWSVRHLVTTPLRIIADAIEHDTTGTTDALAPDPTTRALLFQPRTDEIGSLARALEKFRGRAAELKQVNTNFDAALTNMTQGLCLFDSRQRLQVYNPCFSRMFGVPRAGATAETLSANSQLGQLFQPPSPGGSREPDVQVFELADGREIQRSQQAIPTGGWVATFEDTTERKRAQERLSHMARHDALTGLPNRLMFREHTEYALRQLRRGDQVALLYLDLDGFKAVNDTLGHPAGDELLRAVAHRLREHTRKADLVARLGGDEFAIIQVDADQPTTAVVLADRLVTALNMPFEIDGQRVEIGTSIGVVVSDSVDCRPDELLRSADIALYRAKAEGRGNWQLFEAGMDSELRQRRVLEADLRRALTQEQFQVFYQPLVNARTRALIGFEALVRWRHPERGLLAPGEFISLAEETGLIRALGAWVMVRACTDAAGWPDHLVVAVNLSPAQFTKGDLVGDVEHALAVSNLNPHRLELEITESVLMQDNHLTLHSLNQLHRLGVRIAMDDFGTGYSSLSYLRQFRFDKIKIDQSFVQRLGEESGSIEIIRAVVGLGKALGMEVLAEGVETEEQFDILQDEGCDEVQGYLFSKPTPLRDAEQMIDQYLVDVRSLASSAIG